LSLCYLTSCFIHTINLCNTPINFRHTLIIKKNLDIKLSFFLSCGCSQQSFIIFFLLLSFVQHATSKAGNRKLHSLVFIILFPLDENRNLDSLVFIQSFIHKCPSSTHKHFESLPPWEELKIRQIWNKIIVFSQRI